MGLQLAKCFLWALCLMDMWHKSNRFSKCSIWRATLLFLNRLNSRGQFSFGLCNTEEEAVASRELVTITLPCLELLILSQIGDISLSPHTSWNYCRGIYAALFINQTRSLRRDVQYGAPRLHTLERHILYLQLRHVWPELSQLRFLYLESRRQ